MACTIAEKVLTFLLMGWNRRIQWIGQRTLIKPVGQGDWQTKLKAPKGIAVSR